VFGAGSPQVPLPSLFSLNYGFFMYEQQIDYYRRHLMLPDGTHASCGP